MFRLTSVLAALLAAAMLSLNVSGTVAAAAPAPTTAFSGGSGNLLVDGDAEAGKCTTDLNAATTDPGWTILSGSPNVMCYPAEGVSYPATPAPGNAYFGAGPYDSSSAMTQTVPVSAAAHAIDSGTVSFDLSGWLGGQGSLPGRAQVDVRFLGRSGEELGQPAPLPTVTAADRADHTGLLARQTTGVVPGGTRAMLVTVRFLDTGGAPSYSAAAAESGSVDNLSLTLSSVIAAPQLTPPPSTVPRFDHVFMIMMENTAAGPVYSSHSQMPFLHSLMAEGTSMMNYHAVYHPSDENYLAIAGGDTYAHGATYWPDINSPEENIADELQAQGESWKVYEQGMGTPCNASPATEFEFDPYYYPDDAPFINYTDVSANATRCQDHLVDTDELAADLQKTSTTPAFSWIAPDDYYDGESSGDGNATSRAVQDGWLDETVTPILRSPAWQTQRSLLIITWDESYPPDTNTANAVAAVVVGSQGTVRAGYQSVVRYDHYSSGRTIENALGIAPLTANDEYATPFNDAFRAGAQGTS